MKYVIMPLTAPVADIMQSSVVNAVAHLPKTLDGTTICVPFDDTDNTADFTYPVLSYDEWSALQVTSAWVDLQAPPA